MKHFLKSDLRQAGVDENRISAYKLDLTDANSVNRFTTWYREEHDGKLHVLINNAGIHRNIFNSWKKPPLTNDGFEIHWRTNYLGAFHLTMRLLPLLKQSGLESGDARVINVSSHLHDRVDNEQLFNDNKHYHSWDAYGSSKLALIHFAFEIDRRYAEKYNLQSVALHPGFVNTNLTQMEGPQGKAGTALHRISSALASMVLLPVSNGVQTVMMCASLQSLQGGQYYDRCCIADSTGDSKDVAASKRLWDQSEKWVRTLADPDEDGHEQI